jgi:hypothetical protein
MTDAFLVQCTICYRKCRDFECTAGESPICYPCERYVDIKDDIDRSNPSICSRWFIIFALRYDLKTVKLEREAAKIYKTKPCFLIQKYIHESSNCSYEEISLLIDHKMFRSEETYKIIIKHLNDQEVGLR